MDDRRYDVTFDGELLPDADPAEVRLRLAALFKSDAAAIERLFSGGTVVIKKGVDEATAFRYRDAMRQAGAVCRVRPVPADAAGAAREEPASDLASAAILPAGELLPQPPSVATPHFDLDGLSIAAVGVDLVEAVAVAHPPLPDISGITLAPPGSDLIEKT